MTRLSLENLALSYNNSDRRSLYYDFNTSNAYPNKHWECESVETDPEIFGLRPELMQNGIVESGLGPQNFAQLLVIQKTLLVEMGQFF